MKRSTIFLLLATFLMVGCSESDFGGSEQNSLLGKAVNFDASISDAFVTRATYYHDGSFNEGDHLTIFRQEAVSGSTTQFSSDTEISRVYSLQGEYASTVNLGTSWKVLTGAMGTYADKRSFVQTAADSLVWENGSTVRFRAWGRSNLANVLNNSKTNKASFYPDYTLSDWITVSGPTETIPMKLLHLACRIGFAPKSGNELAGIELCTEASDYVDDTEEGGLTAEEKAKTVEDAYHTMCMPAGVNMSNGTLYGLTQNHYTNTSDFSTIESSSVISSAAEDGLVPFGLLSADEIVNLVEHPQFMAVDGRRYMISIPYLMDNGTDQGSYIHLPAYTRFRVRLKDVNNGDQSATTNTEGSYHILTIGEVENNGTKVFADGIDLMPGYSYLFTVGYKYGKFTMSVNESLSWTEQDAVYAETASADGSIATAKYDWWKKALFDAYTNLKNGKTSSYLPEFKIGSAEEFLEFIHLVNGTAATYTSGLTLNGEPEEILEPNATWTKDDETDEEGNAVTVTEDKAPGYVFYWHYQPASSTTAAKFYRSYLTGPYSFYEKNLNTKPHFKITLTADIDLQDVEILAIGNSADHPFEGIFDGAGHTLKNVYVKGGCLFDYVKGAAISNLKIESNHTISLLNTATADKEHAVYIAGVSVNAPTTHAIAHTVTGLGYVVGCVHEGTASGALVGTASNLYMYGCMETGSGLTSGKGALLSGYASGSTAFFAPLSSLTWGRFMCNYYDTQRSTGVNAVGTSSVTYLPQQYIRGAHSHVLKAKVDNLLSSDVNYNSLTSRQKEEMYGLAPWKAMNYAIYKYNTSVIGQSYPCNMQYNAGASLIYDNRYPQLSSGAPNSATYSASSYNVLLQNN